MHTNILPIIEVLTIFFLANVPNWSPLIEKEGTRKKKMWYIEKTIPCDFLYVLPSSIIGDQLRTFDQKFFFLLLICHIGKTQINICFKKSSSLNYWVLGWTCSTQWPQYDAHILQTKDLSSRVLFLLLVLVGHPITLAEPDIGEAWEVSGTVFCFVLDNIRSIHHWAKSTDLSSDTLHDPNFKEGAVSNIACHLSLTSTATARDPLPHYGQTRIQPMRLDTTGF